MKNIICAIFGHRSLESVDCAATDFGNTWKTVGYARVGGSTVDGMGSGHLFLNAECPRCGERYRICNVHARTEKDFKEMQARLARAAATSDGEQL